MKNADAGRFVVFDVETPNRFNDRMSAIGISVVEGSRIVDEFFSYVDPEVPFDPFNTQLTGISAETVAGAPNFGALWPRIEPILSGGVLVAHNAAFDLTVLKKCLKDYRIEWRDSARYACTVQIGRRELPGVGHGLGQLCDYYGIGLDHHKADSDSHAAAEILIRYIEGGADVERYIKTWRFGEGGLAMCGRYWFEESPELRPIVEAMNRSPLVARFQQTTSVKTCGEVRPADVAPVIASNKSGQRAVFPMKWGFTGRTLLINARAETAAEKPTFRVAWASHRCIVPASYYFEWQRVPDRSGRKRPGDRYLIQPRGSAVTWLCGLYRIENGLPCFVILTREPADDIRFIHDRMPLMLPEECVGEWIRPDADPKRLIDAAVTDVVFERAEPAPADDLLTLT